eukprot:1757016-Rhodomonas_salina.1
MPPGLCLPRARELSLAVQVGCITNTHYVSPGLSAHQDLLRAPPAAPQINKARGPGGGEIFASTMFP